MKSLPFKASIFILFFGTAFATTAVAQASEADSTTVLAAIRQVNIDYGDAFIKGDSTLFLNSYAPDACIMPANSPAICGVNGQLSFFKFVYKAGIRDIKFKTLDIFGLTPQYVTEQGTYEMFGPGQIPAGKGKYLVLWKKTSAGWKMFRDIFNADSPTVHNTK